jgi:hypothetical protein
MRALLLLLLLDLCCSGMVFGFILVTWLTCTGLPAIACWFQETLQ